MIQDLLTKLYGIREKLLGASPEEVRSLMSELVNAIIDDLETADRDETSVSG